LRHRLFAVVLPLAGCSRVNGAVTYSASQASCGLTIHSTGSRFALGLILALALSITNKLAGASMATIKVIAGDLAKGNWSFEGSFNTLGNT
jgi:hypothetical protein